MSFKGSEQGMPEEATDATEKMNREKFDSQLDSQLAEYQKQVAKLKAEILAAEMELATIERHISEKQNEFILIGEGHKRSIAKEQKIVNDRWAELAALQDELEKRTLELTDRHETWLKEFDKEKDFLERKKEELDRRIVNVSLEEKKVAELVEEIAKEKNLLVAERRHFKSERDGLSRLVFEADQRLTEAEAYKTQAEGELNESKTWRESVKIIEASAEAKIKEAQKTLDEAELLNQREKEIDEKFAKYELLVEEQKKWQHRLVDLDRQLKIKEMALSGKERAIADREKNVAEAEKRLVP